MLIPSSFANAIKNTFYDKTVTKYSTDVVVDSEGKAAKAGTTVVSGTFLANVHFNNLEKVQERYGIKEKIDAMFTTDASIPLLQIVGYLGRQFEIFEVIPNDSHYLLMGRKWSSRSSTSISA